MAIQVTLVEAQTRLPELVARAEAGEEVILTRAGTPVATLNPVADAARLERTPGAWTHLGRLKDPDLFLRPDPELEDDADGPIFPER